jgi:3-oxoacyl-[acyl-carrier-protein] synthase III
MSAYITATGAFLPGYPVPNDEIEDYIGQAGRASSDLKDLILANCGIKTRHYAIDKTQRTVVSNSAMAAAAVRNAAERAGLGPNDIELLSAATTMPDVMAPGHASMVHGELGYGPLEIATAHGICSCGMMALKNAYLQVAIGEKRNAICVASELASRGFKSTRYEEMGAIDDDGSLPMETAFLRYMLSDGAGAAVVESVPATSGISLRIDWISLTSFANTEKACMFFGSNDNACAKTWGDYPSVAAAAAGGALALRQKLSLLPHLVRVGIDEYERLHAMGKFDPETVTWFPAHYSSERMKSMMLGEFARRGVATGGPQAWYSNLTRVGNIGSAAIFVILDEMMTEGLIRDGDTLLCMVPESGRFVVSFMHLTAVTAAAVSDPGHD